jgi:hypothetical protein
MQGQAFMGQYEDAPRDYLFGFRGRMDERYDFIRSVRNDRYIYIRNYMPHLIYGQYIGYMWITQTTQVWDQMYQSGELEWPQTYFWEPKPVEELYDLSNDPYEINNLADSDDHRLIKKELKDALREHLLRTRDTGFLHEGEMHRRANEHDLTIYEMAQDDTIYPLERIYEFAEIAAGRDNTALAQIVNGFEDDDPAIRYWSVAGVLIRGEEAFQAASEQIRFALNDENPTVQVAAAKALIEFGSAGEKEAAVERLIELAPADKENAFVSIAALNILSELEDASLVRIKPAIRDIAVVDPNLPGRPNDYVRRLLSDILDEEE